MFNLTSSSVSSLVHPLHFVNQKEEIKRTIKHYVLGSIQSFYLFVCLFFTFYMYGCFARMYGYAVEYLVPSEIRKWDQIDNYDNYHNR